MPGEGGNAAGGRQNFFARISARLGLGSSSSASNQAPGTATGNVSNTGGSPRRSRFGRPLGMFEPEVYKADTLGQHGGGGGGQPAGPVKSNTGNATPSPAGHAATAATATPGENQYSIGSSPFMHTGPQEQNADRPTQDGISSQQQPTAAGGGGGANAGSTVNGPNQASSGPRPLGEAQEDDVVMGPRTATAATASAGQTMSGVPPTAFLPNAGSSAATAPGAGGGVVSRRTTDSPANNQSSYRESVSDDADAVSDVVSVGIPEHRMVSAGRSFADLQALPSGEFTTGTNTTTSPSSSRPVSGQWSRPLVAVSTPTGGSSMAVGAGGDQPRGLTTASSYDHLMGAAGGPMGKSSTFPSMSRSSVGVQNSNHCNPSGLVFVAYLQCDCVLQPVFWL